MNLNGKVLIVEDDIVNTEIMREIFRNLSINANFADNGRNAVEILKVDDTYSLVFMDINMPVMGGVEATKEIRKFSDVPIIALTGDGLKEDREKYKSIGMNDTLTKPFDLNNLQEILSKYLIKDKSKQIKQFSDELGVGEDVFKTLLSMFQPSLQTDLGILQDNYKNRDYENLRKIAHKIKGSSSNMRFENLAKVASEIENIAKTKENLDKLENKIDRINKEVEEVLSYEL